jgi:hypothetical protein
VESAALWTTFQVDHEGLDNASRYPHFPHRLLRLLKKKNKKNKKLRKHKLTNEKTSNKEVGDEGLGAWKTDDKGLNDTDRLDGKHSLPAFKGVSGGERKKVIRQNVYKLVIVIHVILNVNNGDVGADMVNYVLCNAENCCNISNMAIC